MKYKFFLVALFFVRGFSSHAQLVPPGTELQELVKIMQVYENTPGLSFDMHVLYRNGETHLDTMDAACKLSYGKTLLSNSDYEFLKGNQYSVYVDKEDSIVFAMPRKGDETILRIPLLDSTFRAAHVDSMKVTPDTDNEGDDSLWVFRVSFKSESIYSFYNIYYDPHTCLIKYIFCHLKNVNGEYNLPVDSIIDVFVKMTNYSDAEIDPILFNEYRYFYRLNGSLFLQPAWQNYELETL